MQNVNVSKNESQMDFMLEKVHKRYKMWLIISLIPVVSIFTMGCAIFCYNTYSYMKSKGRTTGNFFFRLLLLLYGLIIIPILMISALDKIKFLGNLVTGLH